MKVIGENVLVEIIEEEQSGIVSATEENIVKGKVLSVGKDISEISKEDIIWFNKFDAINLPFNVSLYVIEKSDIIVVEENE